MFAALFPQCAGVCERQCVFGLIIAAPLVFSGGSSRISLRLSPEWDHRARIVLACGETTEMGECPFPSSFSPPPPYSSSFSRYTLIFFPSIHFFGVSFSDCSLATFSFPHSFHLIHSTRSGPTHFSNNNLFPFISLHKSILFPHCPCSLLPANPSSKTQACLLDLIEIFKLLLLPSPPICLLSVSVSPPSFCSAVLILKFECLSWNWQ